MTKNEAVIKINKMGKVGHISALVLEILLIAALVLSVLATVIWAVIFPKGFLTVQIEGSAAFQVDVTKVDKDYDVVKMEQEISAIQDGIDNGSIDMKIEIGALGGKYALDKFSYENGVVNVSGSAENYSSDLKNLLWLFLAADIDMAVTLLNIIFIYRLCKAFSKCESPFTDEIIKKMKQLAFSLIPWVVLSNITNNLLWNAFSAGGVLNININFTMIIVVLLILALAYIFQYGAVLQRESDETL